MFQLPSDVIVNRLIDHINCALYSLYLARRPLLMMFSIPLFHTEQIGEKD